MTRSVVRASAIVVTALTIASARAAAPIDLPGSAGATRPVVAVDPYGTAYVAATSASGESLVWTMDDGASSRTIGGLFSTLPGGPPAAIATDAAGYPHLAERTEAGVTVRRSIDGAQTWDRGSVAAAPPADRAFLAAGRFNSVVEGATLVLASETAGIVTVSRSIDGGLSFAQRAVASASPECTLGAVVADESVDRVWLASGCDDGVRILRSTDGGLTFARAATIAAAGTRSVTVARDRHGPLLAAWTDASGAHLARSTDDGGTWSTTASAPGATDVAIASGSNGDALVAWTGGGAAEVARSADGGLTFGAPVRIDDAVGAPALRANPAGGYVLCYQHDDALRAVRL